MATKKEAKKTLRRQSLSGLRPSGYGRRATRPCASSSTPPRIRGRLVGNAAFGSRAFPFTPSFVRLRTGSGGRALPCRTTAARRAPVGIVLVWRGGGSVLSTRPPLPYPPPMGEGNLRSFHDKSRCFRSLSRRERVRERGSETSRTYDHHLMTREQEPSTFHFLSLKTPSRGSPHATGSTGGY